MFSDEVVEAVREVAGEYGVDPAALLAVAEVESGRRAFAVVDGRREPMIRFEGHYFDRRLSAQDRQAARRAGLASPEPGGVANPASQTARWRMLARAAAIDRGAAYESTSWGLGQVMGAHWAWLGFANVEALVDEARSGAAGQTRLMARYIVKAGLAGAIRNDDWRAFARGYNGLGYRRNAYHLKIERAFEHHRRRERPRPPAEPGALRPGARGETVRQLQVWLTALGYPVAADAIYGPATTAAVTRFQKAHGLAPDGIAGPQTLASVRRALDRPLPVRFWAWLRRLMQSLVA